MLCLSSHPMDFQKSHYGEDICQAIGNKEYAPVLQFLDDGGSPNATHTHAPRALEEGESLLKSAACSAATDICILLLERGATVFRQVKLPNDWGYEEGIIECPERDDHVTRNAILRNTIFIPSMHVMQESKSRIKAFLLCMARFRAEEKNAPLRDIQTIILNHLADDMGNCMIMRASQAKRIPGGFLNCAVSRLSKVTIQELKKMAAAACISWHASPFHCIDIEKQHGEEIGKTVKRRLMCEKLVANGVVG